MKVKIVKVHPQSAHYGTHEFLEGIVGTFELVHSPSRAGYVSGWFKPSTQVRCYSDVPVEEQEFFFFKVKVEEVAE
jgi:hypothetical protein